MNTDPICEHCGRPVPPFLEHSFPQWKNGTINCKWTARATVNNRKERSSRQG